MHRLALAAVLVASAASADRVAEPPKKIPITTSSAEARQLYTKGRDLLEKLRATDAHGLFEQAVAKDPGFALAWVGLASTAGTTKEFFDAVQHAVALADKVGEPERLVIRGLDAGARGELAKQREAYEKLVALFPGDERAHMLLAAHYFGQQRYLEAIGEFERAIAIDPQFTTPYNQLGYAYRFVDKLADAERTFKKYVELIPNDPNPYDSYGELLMKMGRFDESIAQYRKALAIDPSFTASYVGIANDQMFQDKPGDARTTLAQLASRARNDGERRQALIWSAVSYCGENAWDKALGEIDKLVAISAKSGDLGQQAFNINFRANTLLEAGRTKEAAAAFAEQIATSDKANVPDDVKTTARRNYIYDQARIALANNDLAGARAKSAEYSKAVTAKGIPFEVRQAHELAGMVALATKDWKTATAELAQANQQDPRVLYLSALAFEGKGDLAGARLMAKRAAEYNGLFFNYAYVRAKAKALVAKLK